MTNPALELVSYSQSREIVNVPDSGSGRTHGLALGHMTSCFVLKAPSGKLWAVDVPNDMFDDVAIPHAESLDPGLDVRDHVVSARDQDPAASKEG